MTPRVRPPRAGDEWKVAAITAAASLLLVFGLVVAVREGLGWDFEEATRAPLAADRSVGPRYGGWLGSFGVIGWAIAASVSAFAAALTASRAASPQPGESRFLLASAGLSSLLMLDDLFLVHSTLAPEFLGVPKPLMIVALLMLASAWGLVFRRRLLHDPDLLLLGWAVLWYAIALLVDAFGEVVGWGGVREEAAKLVGILGWVTYHSRTSHRAVVASFDPSTRPGGPA